MRKQICVPLPGQAGLSKRQLVDRSGCDRIDFSRTGAGNRPHDHVVCGATGGSGQRARLHGHVARHIKQYGLAHRAYSRIGRRLIGDFRADARRVSDRDANFRQRHAGLTSASPATR
jgi:hypothetical protein